jgi:hypothetical protein
MPSMVMVLIPGCHGWQIDGHGFSRVLVFRAVCVQSRPRKDFLPCPRQTQ